MKWECLAQNLVGPKIKKWGTRNGVYYFLGNIPSHVEHAIKVYKKIGGTFIVLSQNSYQYCVDMNLDVILLDNRPDLFLEFDSSEIKNTLTFINENVNVLIFYDIFEFSKKITIPQIMLTHGNSFKNYYIDWRRKVIPYYRWIAGQGPYSEGRLISSGASKNQILRVGLARDDDITKDANRIKHKRFVAKKLGLDLHKPIISYMPTWWGPSSVNDTGLDIIRYISEEYSLIFRPHPNTPIDLILKYENIINKEKLNAVYVPNGKYNDIDLNLIYSASSLFIGDMSSVMLDAFLTEKPLIFAFGDGEHAQLETVYDPIKEVYDKSMKITFQNVSQVNDIIANSLKKPINKNIYLQSKRRIYYDNTSENIKTIIDAIKICVIDKESVI